MSKRYAESVKLVEANKEYDIKEALDVIEKMPKTKFDETVELHVKLGVDSKHADQQVRGTTVLPNGTGKTQKVLVFAKGPKAEEAEKAGADFVGAEELIPKIEKENWFDYDVIVATPDMMGVVGRLGKVLGPKGLMPNPKSGTVTMDVDLVIVSIGVSPNPILPNSVKGLDLGKKGTIAVDEHLQSSIPALYAGGDIVRGGATVILAMGDGKHAAQEMDDMLKAKK